MRDIKGFEGLYAVTSCGRVWSYRNNKFLKPGCTTSGYFQVVLCKDGKNYPKYVHRIVAETYIDNPNNLQQINHKDEIKYHNWINNLEWCTPKYNINYGTGHSRASYAQRLSNKRRIEIVCLETGIKYNSIRHCSLETGIARRSLQFCLSGKQKMAGGLHFERIDK